MPDYVDNYLYISGSEKDVERFLSTVMNNEEQTTQILFGNTVPEPKEINPEEYKSHPLKIRYNIDDWVLWRKEYWGTKHDRSNCYEINNSSPTDKCILFDTAWNPANPWVYHTAKKFPDLRFTNAWLAESNDQAGEYTVWTEDGEILEAEEESDIHDWRLKHSNAYADEYETITTGNYKDVIETYMDDCCEYFQLEIFLVKRIKKEDLPLFVNKNWENGEAQELYESRLKEDKDA